jgi:hypothetical protein
MDKFRKELSTLLSYPEILLGISEPDSGGKIVVALIGADQAQVDAAVKKAEELDATQLQSLGASEVTNEKAPADDGGLPLGALIGIIVGGAVLVLAIVAFVVWRKQQQNGSGSGSDGFLQSYEASMQPTTSGARPAGGPASVEL